jgi:hypothetical protein
MTRDSSFGGCGALYIKSSIAVNASKVKAIIDSTFDDVMSQRVLTLATPEQVPAALSTVSEFLKARRHFSQVTFLIFDLFLFPSDLKALEREEGSDTARLAETAQLRDFLCSYGEAQGVGSIGNKCLWSLRILHSLWRSLDPSIILIFNAGSIRIMDRDLARINARLVNEGVAWLYTKQDEAAPGFVNYLRLLRERAGQTLQYSGTHEGS